MFVVERKTNSKPHSRQLRYAARHLRAACRAIGRETNQLHSGETSHKLLLLASSLQQIAVRLAALSR